MPELPPHHLLRDPLIMRSVLWPNERFYGKQIEIVKSVQHNDETWVVAGNQLGKDYIAAFIVLWYFLAHHPVKVVTSSAVSKHLANLWGEMDRFIRRSKYQLTHDKGGPLVYNHFHLGKMMPDATGALALEKDSYALALVASNENKGEGLAGHHAPYSLFVGDEACHDRDTEVLTDRGWQKFSSLSGNELFLTMNPVTKNSTYLPATSYHEYHKSGPMHLCERRGVSFCVTPNHNMLWRYNRSKNREKWLHYKLEPMSSMSGTRYIPRTFSWCGADQNYYTIPEAKPSRKLYAEKNVQMVDWLTFLGWFISEGNFIWVDGVPYGVSISQNSADTLADIAQVVQRLGFSPKVHDGQSPCIRVNDRRLAELLLPNGRYSYEKRVPYYLHYLSPDMIEVFLQAFTSGDGHRKIDGRDVLYTSSPKLADDLQILSYKAGRECSVHKRALAGVPAPNGFARYDGYIVYRTRDGLDKHIRLRQKDVRVVDYEGSVYCVTVPPFHTLFTRRNGVCMWSGNSGLPNICYTMVQGWMKRALIFGNPNNSQNFFREGIEGGDIVA